MSAHRSSQFPNGYPPPRPPEEPCELIERVKARIRRERWAHRVNLAVGLLVALAWSSIVLVAALRLILWEAQR